jgi:hypothetical protein
MLSDPLFWCAQDFVKKVIWWVHEDPVAYPPETMVMEIMTEAGAVIFDSSFVKKQWEEYIKQVRE